MARRLVSLAALSLVLVAGCGTDDGPARAVGGTEEAETSRPEPPADVVALVEGVLTPEGKRVFYDAHPRLLDKTHFDTACRNDSELTVVLGCYSRGTISILRVERPELSQIMAVTAVHEMLHAAYAELPVRDRDRVDRLVDAFYAGLDDPEIKELVSQYERRDPEVVPNELHSILPTEVAALSPPLEDYYRRYFADRGRVVAAQESYAAVFRQLEQRVADLHAQLDQLRGRLDSLDRSIAGTDAELQSLEAQLRQLEAQGDVRGYNALIPRQNAMARQHNSMVAEFNQVVDVYNQRVDEVNALALEQNQLATSLGRKPSVPAATSS